MSSQVNGVTPLNQIRLTNVAYVRLKKNNQVYEVAAYRNKVVNWRNKIETDLNEVLQVQDVFTNVARGLAASNNDLLRGFDTADKEVICKEILDKGEFQVSELERKTLLEGMFRDVASIVVEKSYNTETGRAYSMSMIQNAMKDVHFSVNLSKGAKQQALDVIRRLKKVMPIARTKLALRISTPSVHAEELQAMLVANAADIGKTSVTNSTTAASVLTAEDTGERSDSSMTVIETNISPENFRVVEDLTTSLTKGKGILEIIHQQQALAPVGARDEEDEHQGTEDRVQLVPQCEEGGDRGSKGRKHGAKEGGNKSSSATEKDDKVDEVVFFMAKGGQRNGDKKKKKDKKKLRAMEQQREEELLEQEEGEEAAAALRALAVLDQKARRGGDGARDGPAPKESKKSKKNKRLEKEKQKQLDSQEQERSERLLALETERLESSVTTTDSSVPTTATVKADGPGNMPFKCNTCSAGFAESAAHRAHFKSDWHRINLKRKLLKLPLVTSEEEFYSANIDHWDCSIDA
mmetsp:Transcript_26202/g.49167  ORF Transcript_26202/g.49167 Transcript_26202/m.49167 type:complete len:522 (+) Transcript_26202:59-1624(+)